MRIEKKVVDKAGDFLKNRPKLIVGIYWIVSLFLFVMSKSNTFFAVASAVIFIGIGSISGQLIYNNREMHDESEACIYGCATILFLIAILNLIAAVISAFVKPINDALLTICYLTTSVSSVFFAVSVYCGYRRVPSRIIGSTMLKIFSCILGSVSGLLIVLIGLLVLAMGINYALSGIMDNIELQNIISGFFDLLSRLNSVLLGFMIIVKEYYAETLALCSISCLIFLAYALLVPRLQQSDLKNCFSFLSVLSVASTVVAQALSIYYLPEVKEGLVKLMAKSLTNEDEINALERICDLLDPTGVSAFIAAVLFGYIFMACVGVFILNLREAIDAGKVHEA